IPLDLLHIETFANGPLLANDFSPRGVSYCQLSLQNLPVRFPPKSVIPAQAGIHLLTSHLVRSW
ncbi:hypothetical protein, partial [Sphingobium yanoikuyae]|uniref:hypothetical protein n=1 Tax=Sphingobium yanoikuyae TaxID=13690 RepID=UPI0035AFEF44